MMTDGFFDFFLKETLRILKEQNPCFFLQKSTDFFLSYNLELFIMGNGWGPGPNQNPGPMASSPGLLLWFWSIPWPWCATCSRLGKRPPVGALKEWKWHAPEKSGFSIHN